MEGNSGRNTEGKKLRETGVKHEELPREGSRRAGKENI